MKKNTIYRMSAKQSLCNGAVFAGQLCILSVGISWHGAGILHAVSATYMYVCDRGDRVTRGERCGWMRRAVFCSYGSQTARSASTMSWTSASSLTLDDCIID